MSNSRLFSLKPLAKDFIETSDGLIFAVVENGSEHGKVLCFLRYVLQDGHWQKVNTEQANQYLSDHHPHYLYYSPDRQAHCHAVDLTEIYKLHQPRVRLKDLMTNLSSNDVERDCVALCHLFEKHDFDINEMGVTGSVLIAAQKPSSDIDLVFYSRDSFNKARKIVKELIQLGDCDELKDSDWLESYDRRSCDLTYDEYVWHEKRKFNKAVVNQRKFDLSYVSDAENGDSVLHYKKIKQLTLSAEVVSDLHAFDYPAEFAIEHQLAQSIVCYTATYTGQAFKGEWVEVAGQLEESSEGVRRIVVGSSREAHGEYIKVIDEK